MKEIILDSHFDLFVQSQVQMGKYKTETDVVQAGLQLLEYEEKKVEQLKSAIQKGIDSGLAYDFDPIENLKELKQKKHQ